MDSGFRGQRQGRPALALVGTCLLRLAGPVELLGARDTHAGWFWPGRPGKQGGWRSHRGHGPTLCAAAPRPGSAKTPVIRGRLGPERGPVVCLQAPLRSGPWDGGWQHV